MTLEQILARLTELRGLIDKETDTEKIKSYGEEVRKLEEQKGILTGTQLEKDRAAARAAFNEAKPEQVRNINEKKGDENIKALFNNKRSAAAFLLGGKIQRRSFTDEEKRAVGSYMMTTAETFVEATADADGVINGGVLIPTSTLTDLLTVDKVLTPVLSEVLSMASNVAGLTVYPYRSERGSASYVKEGKTGPDQKNVFSKLQLIRGELQISIPVTDELMRSTPIDVGNFIIQWLENDLVEDWSTEILYGTGVADSDGIMHAKGILADSTTVIKTYASGKALDTVLAAIHALKSKYRRGAKVHLSQGVADLITETKNSQGDYVFQVINNQTAIVSIGGLPCDVDDTLAEGEAFVGNVGRWFKMNIMGDAGITFEAERHAKERYTDNIVSIDFASAGIPTAFIRVKAA